MDGISVENSVTARKEEDKDKISKSENDSSTLENDLKEFGEEIRKDIGRATGKEDDDELLNNESAGVVVEKIYELQKENVQDNGDTAETKNTESSANVSRQIENVKGHGTDTVSVSDNIERISETANNCDQLASVEKNDKDDQEHLTMAAVKDSYKRKHDGDKDVEINADRTFTEVEKKIENLDVPVVHICIQKEEINVKENQTCDDIENKMANLEEEKVEVCHQDDSAGDGGNLDVTYKDTGNEPGIHNEMSDNLRKASSTAETKCNDTQTIEEAENLKQPDINSEETTANSKVDKELNFERAMDLENSDEGKDKVLQNSDENRTNFEELFTSLKLENESEIEGISDMTILVDRKKTEGNVNENNIRDEKITVCLPDGNLLNGEETSDVENAEDTKQTIEKEEGNAEENNTNDKTAVNSQVEKTLVVEDVVHLEKPVAKQETKENEVEWTLGENIQKHNNNVDIAFQELEIQQLSNTDESETLDCLQEEVSIHEGEIEKNKSKPEGNTGIDIQNVQAEIAMKEDEILQTEVQTTTGKDDVSKLSIESNQTPKHYNKFIVRNESKKDTEYGDSFDKNENILESLNFGDNQVDVGIIGEEQSYEDTNPKYPAEAADMRHEFDINKALVNEQLLDLENQLDVCTVDVNEKERAEGVAEAKADEPTLLRDSRNTSVPKPVIEITTEFLELLEGFCMAAAQEFPTNVVDFAYRYFRKIYERRRALRKYSIEVSDMSLFSDVNWIGNI